MSTTSSPGQGSGLDIEAMITFILSEPGMLRRLLAEHVPDEKGLCRVCSTAGTRRLWPCRVRGYAELALRQRGEEDGPGFLPAPTATAS